MLTVRFPNGQSITYNDAVSVSQAPSGHHYLFDKKKDFWLAMVPPGCVIEAVTPCKVEYAPPPINAQAALNYVVNHLRDYRDWKSSTKLAEIKRVLQDFNLRQKKWMR